MGMQIKKLSRSLVFLSWVGACSTRITTPAGPSDQQEFEDLKAFYEQLKEGQSHGFIESALGKKHELICEGNPPGAQRCIVKFRVAAGEDFGASQLGIAIANANVKDEFRVLRLDFRGGRLISWESRSEKIRR